MSKNVRDYPELTVRRRLRVNGALELNGAAINTTSELTPADAFVAGTGTVFKTSILKTGGIIKTEILLDLTGTLSSTTDLDIIGTTGVSHMGRIKAANNGTVWFGQMTCLETPAGGVTDIDLYSATEATGAYNALVSGLTETALLTHGGVWAAGVTPVILSTVPAADQYLYLTCGAAGTAGTYTAGRFLIELWGV